MITQSQDSSIRRDDSGVLVKLHSVRKQGICSGEWFVIERARGLARGIFLNAYPAICNYGVTLRGSKNLAKVPTREIRPPGLCHQAPDEGRKRLRALFQWLLGVWLVSTAEMHIAGRLRDNCVGSKHASSIVGLVAACSILLTQHRVRRDPTRLRRG